jgi:hypothetical protein
LRQRLILKEYLNYPWKISLKEVVMTSSSDEPDDLQPGFGSDDEIPLSSTGDESYWL